MKSQFLLLCIISTSLITAIKAQSPTIAWQKTYGGTKNDSLICISTTNDGGFIVSGFSNSDISSNKTQNSYGGSYDFWILKLNDRGRIQWDKTLGGFGKDDNPVVMQAPDGGYLVGGRSMSDISGNKTENAFNGSADYWVIKLDKDGLVQWNNTVGNIQLEGVQAMANMPEKGTNYMIAGYSYSGYGNDKTDENRGANLWADYWIVKLDGRGKIKFDKTIGGKNEDFVTCMKLNKDSTYVLGGYSYSPAGYQKTDSFKGNNDFWVYKMDALGNRIWDHVYGGALSDYQTSIDQTSDGGFIMGGYSNSPASFDKSGPFKGVTDYWVIRTDANGIKKWDKTLGGSLGDYLTCLIQTSDKGFLLGGYSSSGISGDKTENSKGGDDIWLVKLDSTGKTIWNKTFGGSGSDRLSSLKEIAAGQYILGGTSNSPVSGDKTDATVGGTGANDYWIMKVTATPTPPAVAVVDESTDAVAVQAPQELTRLSLQAAPNPTKGLVNLTYSGTKDAISLIVYNNTGKVVKKANLSAGSTNYQLDISKEAAGTYYVVINCKTSSATRVVIKQ